MRSLTALLLLVLPPLSTACTPYAVATTARPLAPGERSRSQIFTVVPGGLRSPDDSSSVAVPSIDLERRFGLDERSDLGVRIPSFSGVVVTYKRRLDGLTEKPGAATGLMVGGGFVNFGQHAHLEATLIRSGSETGRTVPYGGLRALQVIPLSSTAPNDSPTLGAFGGLRFGNENGGITTELGVFYDRSALKMRRGDLVVVPSISVHGGVLRRLLPGRRRQIPTPPWPSAAPGRSGAARPGIRAPRSASAPRSRPAPATVPPR
jgi:hypothetical protein